MKKKVIKFLGKLAEHYIAFRGTLDELAEMMGYDSNEVKSAVLELISNNEIVYLIDEDTYTLTIREEDENE